MESLSKTPLSLTQARQIVARQLGPQREIESLAELKESYFNAAYHLRLADGWECVLKIAPPRQTTDRNARPGKRVANALG
jgi:hypothetical protein